MSSTRPTFDPAGPLPARRLAVEASAGTGKTYTLAALVTRFVAEQGLAIGELLVVTFTRAATHELRARVRERLVQAAAHLAAGAPPTDDPVLTAIAAAGVDEQQRRRHRLEAAVADFDAATITTIHGFAAQVLGTIGSLIGTDPDIALVDDARDLTEVACADVLAAAAVEPTDPGEDPAPLPKLTRLTDLTKIALGTPDLLLLPEAGDDAAPEHHLTRELVAAAVAHIREHRARAGTRSFDDLLTVLRDALRDREAVVARVLRDRYRVALIDEFQDTDPVQWEIFRTLFTAEDPDAGPDGAGTLVLVGDPKQAIYAFRGADVHTYVDAVSGPGETRSLGTNWRSDGAVLTALDRLFRGVTFGDERIAFSSVLPAEAHEDRHLAHADGRGRPPALEVHLATGADIERIKSGALAVGDAMDAVCSDLCAHVRDLLDHVRVPETEAEGGHRPLRPSDVAVLVRTGDEAAQVQRRLVDQGVPAVLARGGSVLESPAATQWRWLLEALARPADPSRARTFALSWFAGWSAEEVDDASERDLATLQDQLQRWAEHLALGGVNELVRRVWAESGVAARVLARPDGDRELTDLDHLAELLRTEATGSRASVASLLAVLATEPATEAEADHDQDLASRRIESEADAVQIMTVWVSKGLEFPVVCCPTLWRMPLGGEVTFHDAARGVRALDLAGKGSAHKDQSEHERAGELLRLLYVAFTRAKHQTVVWWASTKDADRTGLAHVLFARNGDGTVDPEAFGLAKVALPADDALPGALGWLVGHDGLVAVSSHGHVPAPAERWAPAATRAGDLAAASLARTPARTTARWSFTAITAGIDPLGGDHQRPDLPETAGGTDEGAQPPDPDERAEPEDTARPEAPGGATAAWPLASLPAGADFGVLVHGLLEQVDFTVTDVMAAFQAELDRQLAWRAFDLTPIGEEGATAGQGRSLLVEGLRTVLETPLGHPFGGLRLRDLARADRLDELSFDLRLADGGPAPTVREVGRLVLDHLDPDDPYRAWAEGLAHHGSGGVLAGHLTGSIDLVGRVPGGDGPRFVVVDYKTNRLHRPGCPPGADDYHPRRLVAAMAHHHYPLQALLYAVALHRYLRWRLADYRPDRHLGGAAYLFVRGLCGTGTATVDGVPHGVAAWDVPPALVVALSDLLDGRRPTGGTEVVDR